MGGSGAVMNNQSSTFSLAVAVVDTDGIGRRASRRCVAIRGNSINGVLEVADLLGAEEAIPALARKTTLVTFL